MANRVELPIVVLNDEAPYNPVAGAACIILKRGTASEATVYTDSGATNTTSTQPLSTDSAGRLSGWVPRGAYDIQITIPGRTPYVEPLDAAPAKDGDIDTAWLAEGAVTGAKINSAAKDAAAGTASLRTLGTGATQAAAGNDARLSDERTPKNASVTPIKMATIEAIEAKATMPKPAATLVRVEAGPVTVKKIEAGADGQIVHYRMNTEITWDSEAVGGNLILKGDFVSTYFDVLSLAYEAKTSQWLELSRSH